MSDFTGRQFGGLSGVGRIAPARAERHSSAVDAMTASKQELILKFVASCSLHTVDVKV